MHVYTTSFNIENFECYINIAFMLLCSLSNREKVCFQWSRNRSFKYYLHELNLY
jgi:hypothetical protein